MLHLDQALASSTANAFKSCLRAGGSIHDREDLRLSRELMMLNLEKVRNQMYT